METTKKNGCWKCKHLDYYDAYFEESIWKNVLFAKNGDAQNRKI